MPDPKRLLTAFAKATVAVRAAPGRTGRILSLHDASDVLVIGDLHGNLGNFQAALKLADLNGQFRRHLVFQEVIHGPNRYPGGGDKSHQLLDLIAALTCQYPERVHFLPGNHELAQASGRSIAKGDDDYNDLFVQGVRSAYGDAGDDVYAAYREFIAAAPLAVRTPNRVFISHSLPSAVKLQYFRLADLQRETEPADLETTGSVYSLVWGRDTRSGHVAEFLQIVDADGLVTGHLPCENGFWAPNDRQIVLDAMGTPAGYCLVPAERTLAAGELITCTGIL